MNEYRWEWNDWFKAEGIISKENNEGSNENKQKFYTTNEIKYIRIEIMSSFKMENWMRSNMCNGQCT